MPIIFKLKIRNGAAEFEAEGTQKFVEAKLKEFRPMLSLPKSGKPEKSVVKSGRKKKLLKTHYPEKTIKSLKDFLKTAKPKTQIESLLAIAKHHIQHFNADRFTNKDLSSAAQAVGKKLGNVSALLKTALKSKKIKKLEKGTWQLLAGKPNARKTGKPSGSKKQAKAKPIPKKQAKGAPAKPPETAPPVA